MINLYSDDLNLVEQLMKMMTTHRIDKIKINNIEITKTIHLAEESPKQDTKQDDIDEELLFFSARG